MYKVLSIITTKDLYEYVYKRVLCFYLGHALLCSCKMWLFSKYSRPWRCKLYIQNDFMEVRHRKNLLNSWYQVMFRNNQGSLIEEMRNIDPQWKITGFYVLKSAYHKELCSLGLSHVNKLIGHIVLWWLCFLY